MRIFTVSAPCPVTPGPGEVAPLGGGGVPGLGGAGGGLGLRLESSKDS